MEIKQQIGKHMYIIFDILHTDKLPFPKERLGKIWKQINNSSKDSTCREHLLQESVATTKILQKKGIFRSKFIILCSFSEDTKNLKLGGWVAYHAMCAYDCTREDPPSLLLATHARSK